MPWTEETLRRFLDRYGVALSEGNLPAIAECWEVPAFVLSEQGARNVHAAAEIERFFSGAVEWYQSQGLVSTQPELERVERLGQHLVSIDVRWGAFDAGGIERSSERSRYLLTIPDGAEPRIRVAITLPVE